MVIMYMVHREDAGYDAGNEQLADVLLGDDAVHHAGSVDGGSMAPSVPPAAMSTPVAKDCG